MTLLLCEAAPGWHRNIAALSTTAAGQKGGTLIGGTDMNGNPEALGDYSSRCGDHAASGLHLIRGGQPTNVNIRDNVMPEREIDFLFASDNLKVVKPQIFQDRWVDHRSDHWHLPRIRNREDR